MLPNMNRLLRPDSPDHLIITYRWYRAGRAIAEPSVRIGHIALESEQEGVTRDSVGGRDAGALSYR